MSYMKRRFEDVMYSMSYEERVKFLIYALGYSSEDAEDFAELYEPTTKET